MSLHLKDLRMGISESTYAVLEAEAVAFDTDMQSVARKVLEEFAARRAHAYKVYARRVMANGLNLELPGFETADDGISRKGRK